LNHRYKLLAIRNYKRHIGAGSRRAAAPPGNILAPLGDLTKTRSKFDKETNNLAFPVLLIKLERLIKRYSRL